MVEHKFKIGEQVRIVDLPLFMFPHGDHNFAKFMIGNVGTVVAYNDLHTDDTMMSFDGDIHKIRAGYSLDIHKGWRFFDFELESVSEYKDEKNDLLNLIGE